jgi:hypothetical protein
MNPSPKTLETALIAALQRAGHYNSEVQAAPACILWPDAERQWETIVPVLQARMPELLVLGDYAPERRAGPAIWLRCALAGALGDVPFPDGATPIIYLSGVGRSDLRAVDSCPEPLKPLAALQYRGALFSQVNAKDWTVFAFLKSNDGGLGLEVAGDRGTRHAMVLALSKLLAEDLELLAGKHLGKDYFNGLLTGGDPVRDLLQWLDQGETFRRSRPENEWGAFVQTCRSRLAFDPETGGPLAAATKLAEREGPWRAVWDRFSEAPKLYPGIPEQIRRVTPPEFDLLADVDTVGGWPQWNESQEARLADSLHACGNLAVGEAREWLLQLEEGHGARRELAWAELGEAPLARALEWLARLAEATAQSLTGGTVADLAAAYRNGGWEADDAVLRALACVTAPRDVDAVQGAIRAVYMPWAQDAARFLQARWHPERDGLLRTDAAAAPGDADGADCVLFVDGLRFDCAKRLQAMLTRGGFEVDDKPRWAALPSVTGTGKYAVAPIFDSNRIADEPEPEDFAPIKPFFFRKLLENAGWQVLNRNAVMKLPDGVAVDQPAWCEFGDLDHEGHDRGWKLAQRIDSLLAEVRDRVATLLDAGFKRVRIVTDHGWLLLPGGLPKTALAAGLATTKWGRCAALKTGANTNARLFPWYWNPAQHFALADGISCFKAGQDYAHGGLSPQECLTLQLTVTPAAVTGGAGRVVLTDVVWKGLRCKLAVESDGTPDYSGLSADIRAEAGDPGTSVLVSAKPLKKHGTASVIVEDEEMEGQSAWIVIVGNDGDILAQTPTMIGGGD